MGKGFSSSDEKDTPTMMKTHLAKAHPQLSEAHLRRTTLQDPPTTLKRLSEAQLGASQAT